MLWLNYPKKKIIRTKVKWQTLMPDLSLILLAIAFPITSIIIDLNHHRADWFDRSGAVSAIIYAFVGMSLGFVQSLPTTKWL